MDMKTDKWDGNKIKRIPYFSMKCNDTETKQKQNLQPLLETLPSAEYQDICNWVRYLQKVRWREKGTKQRKTNARAECYDIA
jgi:hypothetical protein